MDKLPKFTIFILLAIATVSTVFIVSSNKQKNIQTPTNLPKVTSYAPPAAKADPIKETTVVAADGKFSLTMKEESGRDLTTYIFLLTNSSNGVQKEVYRATGPEGIFSVPLNTFSPDDKYFFLKKIENGKDKYFVIKDGVQVEFSSMFEGKYSDYKITDATGWGGMTLIVINTDKVTGGTGPSFWFDVTGNSFIRLSNRFN